MHLTKSQSNYGYVLKHGFSHLSHMDSQTARASHDRDFLSSPYRKYYWDLFFMFDRE